MTKQIQSWKNADKTANFDAPLAGVSVNEAAITIGITGGASSGFICGVSAEVTGRSCNPFPWIFDIF